MTCDDSGIRRLILASGSPRRRQLLSLLGLPFVIKAADVDEAQWAAEPPTEFVLRMSQAKALAIQDVRPDELVVAADTIVVLEGNVLGKPIDPDDAAHMLSQLRNRPHWVYSGVSMWHPAHRRMACELAESLVWMRNYDDDEIAEYVASDDPMDKAGAYAIQNAQFAPVFHVDGCRLNVMGLPLCHVRRALEKFCVEVPANVPGTCRAFDQHDCDISFEILQFQTG